MRRMIFCWIQCKTHHSPSDLGIIAVPLKSIEIHSEDLTSKVPQWAGLRQLFKTWKVQTKFRKNENDVALSPKTNEIQDQGWKNQYQSTYVHNFSSHQTPYRQKMSIFSRIDPPKKYVRVSFWFSFLISFWIPRVRGSFHGILGAPKSIFI